MPLPLAIAPYTIYNNISQGSKYYYLELRMNTSRSRNIPSSLLNTGESINSAQVLSFIQGMKEAELLTIGTLPTITLDWAYQVPENILSFESLMRDRLVMSEKMFLFYALREEWFNGDGAIMPAAFLARWGITVDAFLSGMGAIASWLTPQFTSIPITWTDKGFINLGSVTQAQIIGTLFDYYGQSLIYTYIVLSALRATGSATQTIDAGAIATTWKIPQATLNAHLIQLQEKGVLDLIPGQISLTWIKRPLDVPSRQTLLERRGKVYSEAGYLLYALAMDILTQLSTAAIMTNWALTEQQLLSSLESLRKDGFLSYAIASSIRWLI